MNINDPLICFCYSVRESKIRDLILENNIKYIWQITEKCDAGGGCTGCHYIIDEMIQEFNSNDSTVQ